jgi:hypothetical protein
MPNINNITSPVTLISYGRSGSSLLSKVFELHPDFAFSGETGNFICDLWRSYEFSAGVIPPLYEKGKLISHNDRQIRLVRESFLTCFPDHKKQWFHKPIGVPTAISSRFTEEEWDKAATWYWNAINSTFPNARLFTILRHPFDVVLSAKSYWGYDEATIWWNYAFMSYLLSHPLSPIKHAISYEEMVLSPEVTIKALFEFLDVPFHAKVMKAFNTVHAPSKSREELSSNKMNRKNEWSQLDLEQVKPKYLKLVLDVFDKYSLKVDFPNQEHSQIFNRPSHPTSQTGGIEYDENPIFQQMLSEYNQKIEALHSEYQSTVLQNIELKKNGIHAFLSRSTGLMTRIRQFVTQGNKN